MIRHEKIWAKRLNWFEEKMAFQSYIDSLKSTEASELIKCFEGGTKE